MYLLQTGKQPGPLLVCHKCDNPGCVNPDHLFIGTGGDNAQDMLSKGRHITVGHPGEKNGRAVLTRRDVLAIRQSSKTGVELAAEYGVCDSTISLARLGKRWGGV